MPAFLVTGNPGSGKSALAMELVRRGLAAIDADDDPELAHWEDAAGRRVSGLPRPDRDWLGSHRWIWSRSRLQAILTLDVPAVFVCGIARNQDELRDLFDRVFLLRIDGRTQEARLAAYDALHPPGRSEAGRQEIRQGRAAFEAQMLKAGAIPLDGTAPTAVIASELLALTAGTGDIGLSACGSVSHSGSDVPHRSGARTCPARWPCSASVSSRGGSAARPVRPGAGIT
jgi:hypothetical protein